jgi:predicted DNA-binding transcriptional regulator AlpA
MDDVEDKLVAQPKLAARHDCSLQTIWRRRKDPKLNFPEPVVINGRNFYWLSELEQWERRMAAASVKAGVA